MSSLPTTTLLPASVTDTTPPDQVQQSLVRALSAVVDNLAHTPAAGFDLTDSSYTDEQRYSGVYLALQVADAMLDLTTALRSTHPAAAPRTGIPVSELEDMTREKYAAAAAALSSPLTRQLALALAGR